MFITDMNASYLDVLNVTKDLAENKKNLLTGNLLARRLRAFFEIFQTVLGHFRRFACRWFALYLR